ncbi:MAG: hypothetical protein LUH58_00435 [Lachnospiraceae bacterium]|nr:hypothetical protein [Lachnospiraceae bacterium]
MKIRNKFEELLTEGASALSNAREYFGVKLRELNERQIREQQQLAQQQRQMIIQANADQLATEIYEAVYQKNYINCANVQKVSDLRFSGYQVRNGKAAYYYTILMSKPTVLSPSDVNLLQRSMNQDIGWMNRYLHGTMPPDQIQQSHPFYWRGFRVIGVRNVDSFYSVQIAVEVL